MTNQPRWLLSAAAVFRRGGVLVPLDYKLEPHEQQALLAHCRPRLLVVEWPIRRKLDPAAAEQVWVSEAPDGADLRGASRWEDLPDGAGEVVPRARDDLASKRLTARGPAGGPRAAS